MSRLFICCFCWLSITTLFSNETARLIIEQQPESILLQTKSRIYLRPEMVNLTNQGLFLGYGATALRIPKLLSDSSGCFIVSNDDDDDDYYICYNPRCIRYKKAFYGSRDCPSCGEQGDPALK